MTSAGSGVPGRDMTADSASRRGMGGRIVVVLAIGLILRLIIAYLFPSLGFKEDLASFQGWAANLGSEGPWGFYERPFFHDYTPGYLYVLWLVGFVGNVLGGVGALIKLPAILGDIVLGALVYRMASELGASERRATLGAAIVVINPVTWFDSVIWGQVDSFGVVFLLLSIRELWRGRHERAAILAVVAALIKPQLGILIPVLAAITIRRALWPSGGWGDEPAPRPSGTRWERLTGGPIRIVTTGLAGLLTAAVLSAPFGLWLITPSSSAPFVDSPLLRQVLSTAAGYPYITVNAYNLWAIFPVNGSSMADVWQWIPDAPLPDGSPWASILGVPAGVVGAAAFIALWLVASVLVARRPDRLTILVGISVIAVAFFAVPTRVHERYLYPLFAVAAILAAVSLRWRIAYVVAALGTFLNMYVVLTTLYDNSVQGVVDWLGIGEAIRSYWGVAAIALGETLVLGWTLAQLRGGARARLGLELEAAASDGAVEAAAWRDVAAAPGATGAPRGVTAMPVDPPSVRAAAPIPAASVAATRRLLPAWFDRPRWSDLGPLAWFRARISETPIRPDRSAHLAREPRGRLDRLDLWLVIVLVVAAMFLRTFRLADPARMHFDEVYHARTAMEFLQDWRYGIEHSIYEWTHPHLAKYGMAAGIVMFASHDVAASSELGVDVRGAAIEPRRPDPDPASSARDGERVWVVTGDALIAYDLETRQVVGSWAVPGASAVTFDPDGVQLLVGTQGGEILALGEADLDLLRAGGRAALPDQLQPLATLDQPISRLAAFPGGASVVALLPDGAVSVVDLGTGQETGRLTVEGAADVTPVADGDAIVASPADVADPSAVADELSRILGGAADEYAGTLGQLDRDTVVIDVPLTSAVRKAVQDAIDEGSLPGIRIDKVPEVAVAGSAGIDFVTDSATIAEDLPVAGGARGMAVVEGVDPGTQLWATTTDATTGKPTVTIVGLSSDKANEGRSITTTIPLPGPGTWIAFDGSSQMVEVLGTTPTGASTVYVIEPHGEPHGGAVFDDHRLPFAPSALVMDTNPQYPAGDRGAILAFSPTGETASLDVGHYAFSWRLPGVILGALTVGIIFLLARVLFRRRSIGIVAGLLVLFDGMFFVQSRIAMNDVYTGVFILAAYLLFARIWLEPERPRWSFWAAMPTIGLLLGLGLASKWVAAYAIGALGILILARSALGRLILVVGLIGLTAVLGWMALAVPAEAAAAGAQGNLTFALIMIVLTLGAVAVTVYHPIAWSAEEVTFAVGGPPALGILVAFGAIALGKGSAEITVGSLQATPLALGLALVILGPLAYAAFAIAGRFGFGPSAPPPPADAPELEPPAPAATGWLRLGSGLGLPVVWMIGSLIVVPLVVYVISYLPWAFIESHQIVAGWPPGHSGQTLLDLTAAMYRYHNDLTAAHAASSPWWAWPLDLKPVWFYQGSFAGDTAASIYDAGNVVIWWLGIPAMAFLALQAFRRRSLALALVLVGFLAQWVSWARIDRAAFQYHYYTSIPFVVLGVAYLVGELWHGASRRTWLFARLAAALALLGPIILWLLRRPLCALANVEAVNAGSQACTVGTGSFSATLAAAGIGIAGILIAILVVRVLVDVSRRRSSGEPFDLGDLVPLLVAAVLALAAAVASRWLPDANPVTAIQQMVPELFFALVGVPLLLVAYTIVTARDARRFAVGMVAAAIVWFIALYPNIAAVPLPAAVTNAYQLLLPTYPYAFQFSVNTIERGGAISFLDPRFALLVVFLLISSFVVGYAAWIWRAAPASGVGLEDDAATGDPSRLSPGEPPAD